MNPQMTSSLLLIASVLFGGCERAQPATGSPPPVAPAAAPAAAPTADHRVAIAVTEQGYQPASVNVPAGQPVTLVFTRTTDQTCGTQVVFPSLNLRRDLPLNRPVEVTLTPAAGTVSFTCGMNMLHGSIVAQ